MRYPIITTNDENAVAIHKVKSNGSHPINLGPSFQI